MMYYFCNYLFLFKQKTAYEVRISDWSSDVCSSDRRWPPHNQIRERIMKFGLFGGAARGADQSGDSQSYRSFVDYVVGAEELGFESLFQIGKASGRERVCQYV